MQTNSMALARDLIPGMTIQRPDVEPQAIVAKALVLRVEYAKSSFFIGEFIEVEEKVTLRLRMKNGEDHSICLAPNFAVSLMAPLVLPERKLPRENS